PLRDAAPRLWWAEPTLRDAAPRLWWAEPTLRDAAPRLKTRTERLRVVNLTVLRPETASQSAAGVPTHEIYVRQTIRIAAGDSSLPPQSPPKIPQSPAQALEQTRPPDHPQIPPARRGSPPLARPRHSSVRV